jgi:peptidoglycan/xylan/chitin deacetylase (PgdA/CDA1 family)
MPPAALDSAMAELRAQSSPSGRGTTDRPLTPQQARSVSPATLAFGSHGLTHASLPTLSDEQKAREIAGSIARCEAIAGARPASFAYPFGELDEASVSLAAQAGYACACATGDTFVSRRSDVFALPRLRVGNWEAADLRDMLGG